MKEKETIRTRNKREGKKQGTLLEPIPDRFVKQKEKNKSRPYASGTHSFYDKLEYQ
jgi:hypothetical protein